MMLAEEKGGNLLVPRIWHQTGPSCEYLDYDIYLFFFIVNVE
jgi:hypothetical protein